LDIHPIVSVDTSKVQQHKLKEGRESTMEETIPTVENEVEKRLKIYAPLTPTSRKYKHRYEEAKRRIVEYSQALKYLFIEFSSFNPELLAAK
jgi:hypothetical protein